MATLKDHLRSKCGYPVCVQRLLHEGSSLDDNDRLDALDRAVDVQLVVLPVNFSEARRQPLGIEKELRFRAYG